MSLALPSESELHILALCLASRIDDIWGSPFGACLFTHALFFTRTQHTECKKSPWLQNTGYDNEVWAHISSSQNLLHLVTSIQHRMWPLSVHKHNVNRIIQCSIIPPSIPRLKYFYSACTIILMSIITPLTAFPFLSLNLSPLKYSTNQLLNHYTIHLHSFLIKHILIIIYPFTIMTFILSPRPGFTPLLSLLYSLWW